MTVDDAVAVIDMCRISTAGAAGRGPSDRLTNGPVESRRRCDDKASSIIYQWRHAANGGRDGVPTTRSAVLGGRLKALSALGEVPRTKLRSAAASPVASAAAAAADTRDLRCRNGDSVNIGYTSKRR